MDVSPAERRRLECQPSGMAAIRIILALITAPPCPPGRIFRLPHARQRLFLLTSLTTSVKNVRCISRPEPLREPNRVEQLQSCCAPLARPVSSASDHGHAPPSDWSLPSGVPSSGAA